MRISDWSSDVCSSVLLLVEMDGFDANEGIIIVAATNRPDVLDPALLRSGRCDRQIGVPRPDIDWREKILLVHMKKLLLAPDVIVRTIPRGRPGSYGAVCAHPSLMTARISTGEGHGWQKRPRG